MRTVEFPFELEIQRKRVRYVRIKVLSGEKVRLTLPWFIPKSVGFRFIEDKKSWINKTMAKKRNQIENAFRFNGEKYDEPSSPQDFQKFLREAAERTLPAELEALSRKTGLPFRKLTIRSQKTRWGSCSRAKNISLNSALMTLAPDLRAYVMIHELCHTTELNHSARFWKLVAAFCPEYQKLRKEVRNYGLSVS